LTRTPTIEKGRKRAAKGIKYHQYPSFSDDGDGSDCGVPKLVKTPSPSSFLGVGAPSLHFDDSEALIELSLLISASENETPVKILRAGSVKTYREAENCLTVWEEGRLKG